MLTDDGKHLYVSWDEYHMLIERLALKVPTRAGSSTRSCAWPAAACGRATCCRACSTSRWPSCRRAYRAEAGTIQGRLDMAKYITMPKGELAGRVLLVDDLADTGVTLRAVVDRLRGMPPSANCARP
jgi:uncharacterized protein